MGETYNDDEMYQETIMLDEDFDLEEYERIDSRLSIKMGVSSIIGTRDYQQDTLFSGSSNGMNIAIVCDGMGGMASGDLASKTATKILAEDFYNLPHDADIPEFLRREVDKMDQAVEVISDEDGGSGTTLVAVIERDGIMYWVSVGDSRIYMIRKEQIINVNRDHNLRLKLDAELEAGKITLEEYRSKEKQAEALISYIGIGGVPLVDIGKGTKLEENDIIILSSDGLYKRLNNSEVLDIALCDAPDMNRVAKQLTNVVMKRTQRHQDNTSVIAMQYNRYKNKN